jgi:hypothetical protein
MAVGKWWPVLSAIALAVLAAAAFFVFNGVDGRFESEEEYIAAWNLAADDVRLMTVLFLFAGVAMVMLFGYVAGWFLRRGETAVTAAAVVVVIGVCGTLGLLFASLASQLSIAVLCPCVSGGDSIEVFGSFSFTLANFTAGMTILGVALGVILGRALPAAYGYGSIAIALLFFANGAYQVLDERGNDAIGDGAFFLFLLWSLALGVITSRAVATAATGAPEGVSV